MSTVCIQGIRFQTIRLPYDRVGLSITAKSAEEQTPINNVLAQLNCKVVERDAKTGTIYCETNVQQIYCLIHQQAT